MYLRADAWNSGSLPHRSRGQHMAQAACIEHGMPDVIVNEIMEYFNSSVPHSSRGEAVLRRQQITRTAMLEYGMPDVIVNEILMEYCRDSIHETGIEVQPGLAENSDDETN
jgi:hypothetical protein